MSLYRLAPLSRHISQKMLLQGVILDTSVHIKPMWEVPTVDEQHLPKLDEKVEPQTLEDEVRSWHIVWLLRRRTLTSSRRWQAAKLSLQDMRLQMREWGKNEWLSETQLRALILKKWREDGRQVGELRPTEEQVDRTELDLSDPEAVRQKYLARLDAKKRESAFNREVIGAPTPQAPPLSSTSSVGIMPHNENANAKDMSQAYNPGQFLWTVRNNGTPHVIKYMKSRLLRWAVCLDPEMKPNKVHGFDCETFKLITSRPPDADVPDLRKILADTVDRMAIDRQAVMVVSDDDRMLTAAKRQDMLFCSFEASSKKSQYYEHRIHNMYALQHEIEKLNGVSHIASFSGTSVLGGHTSFGFGYDKPL